MVSLKVNSDHAYPEKIRENNSITQQMFFLGVINN